MKIFKKTFVPDQISYNGEIYTVNIQISSGMQRSRTKPETVLKTLKTTGKKGILVEVLSKNLKGKKDIYGNFYAPTKWIFTNE